MPDDNKMTGIQTATIEPPPKNPPIVPMAVIGVIVAAGAAWFAMSGGSIPDGPWPATVPIPEPSTCKVEKGMGAVPDVDAWGCHPAELAAREVLPAEDLRLPAAKVAMYRSRTGGELLALHYEGVEVDDLTLVQILEGLAPTGDDVARGDAESLALPDGWPKGDTWKPTWVLPEGEPGTLNWIQSPAGDISCHQGEVAGAAVWRGEDEVVVLQFKETRECLWKQMHRRSPWQRGGFGGGGFGR